MNIFYVIGKKLFYVKSNFMQRESFFPYYVAYFLQMKWKSSEKISMLGADEVLTHLKLMVNDFRLISFL